MNMYNNANISVIIPVYNVEKYLTACIDSLMCQGNLYIEIILVNDGSTDKSGMIANEYARKDNRIKVIHKENGGASAARNAGLNVALGEYIVFLDSDDWIKEDSLPPLFEEAVKHHADVVMGNMWLCNQDGNVEEPFKVVPHDLISNNLSGRESFIWLVKTRFYLPSPVRYIYRRNFLNKIQARFEEGIMHEDELWIPIILFYAEKMTITDIEFYYYRQNEESVMHTTNIFRRLDSLFRVTDLLIKFSTQFNFCGDDRILKSWWLVNIYRLYFMAFSLLSKVRNSSYIVPEHHLDCFWRDCSQMIPDSFKRCKEYYCEAEHGLKRYTDWRISDLVASVEHQINVGKKAFLIYNNLDIFDLSFNNDLFPDDWVVTTDRRFFQQADLVVFHLPTLNQELEYDLDKREGQTWVSWYYESEKDNYLIANPEINDIFDLSICYKQNDDENEDLLVCLCRNVFESHVL